VRFIQPSYGATLKQNLADQRHYAIRALDAVVAEQSHNRRPADDQSGQLVSWECQKAANPTGTLGKDSGTFAAPRLVHPTIWLNRKRNNLRVYAWGWSFGT